MKRVVSFLLCFLIAFSYQVPVSAEEKLELTAKSAIVMEASTGRIIYEDNSTQALPPASVTKVMTLLLIFEAIHQGKINLQDEVTVSEHAASMGGSQVFLEAGEVQTVEVMIKSIAVASGNDASVAMAEHIAGSESAFVTQMNQKAKELGMKQTAFKNCCGLDVDDHVTSAKDIALMSRELITKYPEVLKYSSIWMDEFTHKTKKGESVFGLSNTNKLLKQYQGCTGLKTGSTSQAKFCLSATAERNGISLIAVVMASNSSKERVKDASTLLDYGFANCKKYTAPSLDKKLKPVPVTKGEQEEAQIMCEKSFETVLVNGESEDGITYNIQRKKNLKAPLKKGDTAGWVTYYQKGSYIGKVKLVVKKNIKEMTLEKSMERILKQFFSS
ncbi:MAG: D-alanyl-D-alanine carboxypeptidase family protein [Lachnospiraceae bacterium]|nr:D-alanyl-D-alanine carboxypeptidase family protein [Lachnospiraceae bacterium]